MILIGTEDGIYRWIEGSGWPVFHSLQGRPIVSLASPGAGVIAAIDGNGQVLESVDNGQHWQEIPAPVPASSSSSTSMFTVTGPVPTLLALWGEPEMLVVATRPMGLYRRLVGAPLPQPPRAVGRARAGAGPAWMGRARTLAAGAVTMLTPPRRPSSAAGGPAPVWTALGKPDVARSKVGSSAVVRALDAGIGGGAPAPWFAAIRGAGLWRSLNQGSTWQQCPGLPDDVLAVRAAHGTPGVVVVATAEGCRHSSDGGQTWEDRSGGLEKARYVSAIEIKPDNPDVLLAGAAPAEGGTYALYESNNGGKAWSQVKRGFPEDIERDLISDIRYDPAAPDNVLVALGSGELWLSRFDRAYWCPIARQTRSARVLCAVA
jgi:hypothetical protein